MPRKPRLLTDDGIYHVIARANNRRFIFKWKDDFLVFKDLLKQAGERHPFKLYHYCLMSNHIHLLLSPPKAGDLPIAMKRLLSGYTWYYRREHRHRGHLWEGRYKNLLIEKESYMLQCGAYIERNPLRAGMVGRLRDYPWSSYPHYAEGLKDDLLDEDPCYASFGATDTERRRRYEHFVGLGAQQDILMDKTLLESYF